MSDFLKSNQQALNLFNKQISDAENLIDRISEDANDPKKGIMKYAIDCVNEQIALDMKTDPIKKYNYEKLMKAAKQHRSECIKNNDEISDKTVFDYNLAYFNVKNQLLNVQMSNRLIGYLGTICSNYETELKTTLATLKKYFTAVPFMFNGESENNIAKLKEKLSDTISHVKNKITNFNEIYAPGKLEKLDVVNVTDETISPQNNPVIFVITYDPRFDKYPKFTTTAKPIRK